MVVVFVSNVNCTEELIRTLYNHMNGHPCDDDVESFLLCHALAMYVQNCQI